MLELDEYRRINFSSAYDVGDSLYVSHGLFNGLFKINKSNGQVMYVKKFPNESAVRNGMGMHGRVFRHGDELIFTPDVASGVHIYNLNSGELQHYPVDSGTAMKSRCIDAILEGDKLWLFYAYYGEAVVAFDLKTKKQNKIWTIRDGLPEEIRQRNLPVFWSCFHKTGRKIYGVIWGSCYFVEFDIDTKKSVTHKVDDEDIKLVSVVYDGQSFWFTKLHSINVIKWESKTGEVTEYECNLGYENQALVNCNIICHNGKILVVPNLGEELLIVDKSEKKLKKFCDLPRNMRGFDDVRKNWRRVFFFDIITDDTLRLYPVGVDMMLDINLETAVVCGYKFELDESWDDDKYKKEVVYDYIDEFTSKQYLAEKKELGLKEYLDYVTYAKTSRGIGDTTNIGKHIWENVSKDL